MYQSSLTNTTSVERERGGHHANTFAAVATTNTTIPYAEIIPKKFKLPGRSAYTSTRGSGNTLTCPMPVKDLKKLEECYWAQWKPSKAADIGRGSSLQTKFVEFGGSGFVPRFSFNGMGYTCQNCQRMIKSSLAQRPKYQQPFRSFMNQQSGHSGYSGDKFKVPLMRIPVPPYRHDETDVEGMTTGRGGETTEMGYTEVGMVRDDGVKRTADKSVCCPCDGTRPLYVNKGCFTGPETLLDVHYPNDEDDQDHVPVKGSPRGGMTKAHLHVGHSDVDDDDDEDYYNEGSADTIEAVQYTHICFDMEDQSCGSNSQARTQPLTNTASLNAERTYPLSSNLDASLNSVGHDYPVQQIHPKPEMAHACSEKRLPHESPTKLEQHEKHILHDHSDGDQSTSSCKTRTNELVRQMKRISECIPSEAKTLVKEMAKIITTEPIQEIKRQAERILESALEAEAGKLKNKSKSQKPPCAKPPLKCILEENPLSCPRFAAHKTCSTHSEKTECNESLQSHEQQLLKRQQDHDQVNNQLRCLQRQQQQQQAEEQRKLIEEQAKEIQRQRDLQKKQALLEQHEMQQRLLAQQLSSAVPPKKQQEKPLTVKRTSPLSAAVARVTGALRHSYPLSKGSKKSKK